MLFFERGDTEVFKAARNKLFASNEKQIDNHTLVLDMLPTYLSVVHTYHWRSVFKNSFWYGCCSLLIFVAKRAIKGTEVQVLCMQGTLQGGRVEDHTMMFIGHFHLPQSYVQAILYFHKTDYMICL